MMSTRMSTALTGALLVFLAALGGCGKDEEIATRAAAPPAAQAPAPAPAGAPPPAEAPTPVTGTAQEWTPEALEELLAPVALYPDGVLGQVLVASTNPQEVLDAGNWLIANPKLEGNALDEAAKTAGFTQPIRALIQFPEVVDGMCQNLDWTEELGQAYVNDQPGVQAAVQRLRVQAESAGNLKSSDYMTVSTETVNTADQGPQQTVIIQPADPQVVYVPQYDPVAAYAPAPAAAPAAAPATTTTTVVEDDDDDEYSTGALITTGLLSFGAGMLVNEVFNDDDDDDDWDNDYGWYGSPPYYPPYPYRPNYGNGFYPDHNYNRPNNYVRGNNKVVVNQNNNYYNRFDRSNTTGRTRKVDSPITAARPQRNDLQGGQLKQRPSGSGVQGKYAGARPEMPKDRPGTAGTKRPKVQGSYAGANRPASGRMPSADTVRTGAAKMPASGEFNRPGAAKMPSAGEVRRQGGGAADRGFDAQAAGRKPAARQQAPAARKSSPAARKPATAQRPATSSRQGGNAFGGAKQGHSRKQVNAASNRGRQSKQHRSGGGDRGKRR